MVLLGLKLLARVKPSEIFLKSISNEITGVEVTYPSSLNARLVRRRLRHIAMSLVNLGVILSWVKGSVKLLQLVSDSHDTPNSTIDGNEPEHIKSHGRKKIHDSPWVLQPSKELEELLHHGDEQDGLKNPAILDICKTFELNTNDVLKYRNSM
ncbi:hypothetical protein Prudu_008203 [Prunus dulcis]|uniref:Uncharacterized protein n=1 Tax=Prunus dulcis TaxID=3755 RepID=A0A4Y1R3R0_PRUDU|nr:hypothetical protein Prudu_008203 [Prunus dulcis]